MLVKSGWVKIIPDGWFWNAEKGRQTNQTVMGKVSQKTNVIK